MATGRHSDEQELKMLREVEVHLQDSNGVMSACRNAGISGNTYDYWRKKFGGLSWSQLSEMMALRKENERLE